jgi:conjugal transfer pilin signal peptidase TrbI
LAQAVLLTSGLLLAGLVVVSHYGIGVDVQKQQCLPYRVFLLEKGTVPSRRGEFVVFRADDRMAPFFRPGQMFIKELAGLPGDDVTVQKGSVAVNGEYRGHLDLLGKLGRKTEDYERAEKVPAEKMWVMGTLPRSFDSRYWGYVDRWQVIGRAYPLF